MHKFDTGLITQAIIAAIMTLFFVGILWNATPQTELYTYKYKTASVSGVQVINATANATYSLNTPEVIQSGVPFNVTLSAVINNVGSTAASVDIYLNGQKVATVNAIAGNNSYTVILPDLKLPATSQVVLASGVSGANITGQIVSITFPGSVVVTQVGALYQTTISQLSTVFTLIEIAILILVVGFIMYVVKQRRQIK